ncbi:GntR family transcriptional regulator [Desertivirga brevis]|uniref:GntR family transcriptional regulator n=1 Tax=Desertivirga brevis TaxID=2810310 RepID=UPI001A966BC2|nr:GntR family transcriptional regulator [Pedobacter sp. SYSU D00873]
MKHNFTETLPKNSLKRENARINVLNRFRWIKALSLQLNKQKRIQPQITHHIKDLICSKILSAGDRLPPIRPFADALSIHHKTIESVYKNLAWQDFVEFRPKRGTYVKGCTSGCIKDMRKALNQKPSFLFKNKRQARRPLENKGRAWLELGSFSPSSDDLMDEKFANFCYDAMRFYSTRSGGNKSKTIDLQESLLKLIEGRSMRVEEPQFLFTRHGKATVFEVFRSLIYDSDWAVMVSSADLQYYQALSNITHNIRFTGADNEGMNTVELESICRRKKVKVVLLRASADYESGLPLSKHRKEHLLHLAEKYDFVVVDIDDYPDSYYGKVNFPLIGKSHNTRVIYISSITISLNTLENFKLVIGPAAFIARLKVFQEFMECGTDKIMERALHSVLSSQGQYQKVKKLNDKCKKWLGDITEVVHFYPKAFTPCLKSLAGFSLWVGFKSPAPRLLVEQVFAGYGISTRFKGNLKAVNLAGIKIGFASGVPSQLEQAIATLSKKLQEYQLTR